MAVNHEPGSRRIQAVDRAAALLRAVAEAPSPPSLAEVADSTSLNRSTAWRLLLTLEHHGFIDRDPDSGRYVLGHEISRLAMRGGPGGLVRRLRPVLNRLSQESGMSAVLSTPTPTEPIAVDQVDPPGRREPNMVGWKLPIHASAAGKLWLAFLDEPDRGAALGQPLPRFTDSTRTEPAVLARELEQIKENGISIDRDEWDEGWSAMSVPVRSDNAIIAMISLMATSQRFQSESYEATTAWLRKAAEAAEAAL
jgi:DNA-binding IclR family transcriptional regulator